MVKDENSNPGVTGTQGSVTEGFPGTKASSQLEYRAPSNGDGVNVGGTSFIKAEIGNGSTTFSTMEELKTLIDNLPFFDASLSGSTITITYYETGTFGNDFMATSSNVNQIAMVTGPFLSGGSDGQTESTTFTVQTGATVTGSITVTVGGVPHTVAVTAGLMDWQVAAQIATKLNADVVLGYTVTSTIFSPTIQFTATTPNTDITPNLTVSID